MQKDSLKYDLFSFFPVALLILSSSSRVTWQTFCDVMKNPSGRRPTAPRVPRELKPGCVPKSTAPRVETKTFRQSCRSRRRPLTVASDRKPQLHGPSPIISRIPPVIPDGWFQRLALPLPCPLPPSWDSPMNNKSSYWQRLFLLPHCAAVPWGSSPPDSHSSAARHQHQI